MKILRDHSCASPFLAPFILSYLDLDSRFDSPLKKKSIEINLFREEKLIFKIELVNFKKWE